MNKQAEKLFKCIGKNWMYQRQNITINAAYLEEDEWVIKATDPNVAHLKPIRIKQENLSDFLNELLPVSDSLPAAQSAKVEVISQHEDYAVAIMKNSNMNLNDMLEATLEQLKKLSEDPEKHAKTSTLINNQVNTVVNISKMQLQMARELRKIQKR